MKIAVLAAVRNEVDILEAFVRHHLELADHLVVAEHRSVDGSSELLRELAGEGLPLTIRPAEGRTLTELMWETAEAMRPDLVLALDADELVAADGPTPARAALESLTDTAPAAIPRRTYVPTPEDEADPSPVARIVHRRAFEPRRRYKVAVPGRFAGDREYGLSSGGNRLVLWGSRAEVAAVSAPGLFLAHYPVRSTEQLACRLVGLWAARVAGGDRPAELGLDTGKVVGRLSRKGDPGPEWLRDVALAYGAPYELDEAPALVRDPLGPVPAQRYPAAAGVSTLGILAGTIEEVTEAIRAGRAASAERTVATAVERLDALEARLSRLEGAPGGARPADEAAPASGLRGKRARRDPLARAQHQVRALEAELEELRESKSWKLTAPIRSLGSLGRSSGKR